MPEVKSAAANQSREWTVSMSDTAYRAQSGTVARPTRAGVPLPVEAASAPQVLDFLVAVARQRAHLTSRSCNAEGGDQRRRENFFQPRVPTASWLFGQIREEYLPTSSRSPFLISQLLSRMRSIRLSSHCPEVFPSLLSRPRRSRRIIKKLSGRRRFS